MCTGLLPPGANPIAVKILILIIIIIISLVKNVGKVMPQSVVREELESLNIRVKGVTKLRCGRRDQDYAKDRPPTPTSLYQWREGPRCRRCDHSTNSAACEFQWSRT